MSDKLVDRRNLWAFSALGSAFLIFSNPVDAQVFVARCNLLEAPGEFRTGASVWIGGKRVDIRIGERGLTRNIVHSPERLLAWLRETFGVGTLMQAGFNDCAGSQLIPQREQPDLVMRDDDSDMPPPPPPPKDDGKGGEECDPVCGCL